MTSEEHSLLEQIINTLTSFTNKYILGVVMVGIFGNILSIVVFVRCRHQDRVTVTYLTPLAVADLGTLIYGIFAWIVTGSWERPMDISSLRIISLSGLKFYVNLCATTIVCCRVFPNISSCYFPSRDASASGSHCRYTSSSQNGVVV
jgi:hypothetical protein